MNLLGRLNATHLPKGVIMGKLENKVAVITGGSSGMALASAKRFVEEGAYVFITGRKQEALDEAVKLIGRNYRAAFRCDLRPEYARHALYGSEGVAAVQRWRIDLDDRVSCFGERFSWFRRVCGEQGGIALIRTHVAQRTEGQEYPGERAEPGAGRHADAGPSPHRGGEADVRNPDPAGKDGSI